MLVVSHTHGVVQCTWYPKRKTSIIGIEPLAHLSRLRLLMVSEHSPFCLSRCFKEQCFTHIFASSDVERYTVERLPQKRVQPRRRVVAFQQWKVVSLSMSNTRPASRPETHSTLQNVSKTALFLKNAMRQSARCTALSSFSKPTTNAWTVLLYKPDKNVGPSRVVHSSPHGSFTERRATPGGQSLMRRRRNIGRCFEENRK